MMTPEQDLKLEIMKENYISRGFTTGALLNRLGEVRAKDPLWPNASVGDAVDKLYAIMENE